MNAAAQQCQGPVAEHRTLVYGIGGTGLSVARHFQRNGTGALYFDTRANPPGLATLSAIVPQEDVLLGELPVASIDSVERVVVSPGVSDKDPNIAALRASGKRICSDIDLFVAEATAPIVAVTGSNGKSTVTTLIARLATAAGRTALAGGNLGPAALDLLSQPAPNVYVVELSSFQLQRVDRLPARVAVLLNVSPDHLDWHGDFDAYRTAKYRIFAGARFGVCNRDDPVPAAVTRHLKEVRTFGDSAASGTDFGVLQHDGEEWLGHGDQPLMRCAELGTTGRHNWCNALAALAACDLLDISMDGLPAALREFNGLPHRMQFVREIDGVRYINDSKATNVGAAIASVQALDSGVVLLAGGQGKGGDFDALADAVAGRLRACVVFGEDAPRLARAFSGRADVVEVGDLAAAIDAARRVAVAGDTVLLAPACASFDQFRNYEARGDAFRDLVGNLES